MRRYVMTGIVLLFVLMAAAAAFWGPSWVRSYQARRAQHQRQAVINLPFRTSVYTDDGKHYASRHTYSAHNHLISDIGLVRLAVVGVTDSGRSFSNGIPLGYNGRALGSTGSTGTGLRRFETRMGHAEVICTFAGLRFRLKDHKLIIADRTIPANDGSRYVVFVEKDGTVREVVSPSKANTTPAGKATKNGI